MEKKFRVHLIICNLTMEEHNDLSQKISKLTKKKLIGVNAKFMELK